MAEKLSEEERLLLKFGAYLRGIETVLRTVTRNRRNQFGAYLRGIETSTSVWRSKIVPTFGAYLRGIETQAPLDCRDLVLQRSEPTYEGLKPASIGSLVSGIGMVRSLPTRD